MAFEEQTLDITVVGDILPQVSVQLNGKPVVFIVDTGAICSIISRKQMKLLGFCESDLSNTEFFSGNELGELDIDVKINDLEMKALFVEHYRTKVNIEGKAVEMIVDTGFGGYLIGPLSLAQDLALPLQETLIQINATYYDGNSKYQAVDLRIEAAGREESDAVYVVYCEETPEDYRAPLIGSLFLMGMQLQFNADGSLEMSGRGMDAEWDDRIIRMVEQG
nr:uncharacterized protein LOC113819042 [Penaeus vannamei]